MEHIENINLQRLKWCCTDFGLTPEELFSELKISDKTLATLLAGEDALSFPQLRKIADFFGRGLLFFLEAGTASPAKVHSPQFRSLANQKLELSGKMKKLIERVERQREVYLSLLEDLGESERQNFQPPAISSKDIRKAAELTRTWLKLGPKYDFDSYRKAIEAQGILVFRSNGYAGEWQFPKGDSILGFALYDARCPVIVVKKEAAKAQQVFTLIHELGHLLLHKESYIDDAGDFRDHRGREQEANRFAGLVLVPDDFLQQIRDADKPDEVSQFDSWLAPYCKVWGVSTEVILRRLLESGRLEQDEYRDYRAWRVSLPSVENESGGVRHRHHEPRHIFGDTYVRAVLDALNSHHISLSKACGYLDHLKIQDVHKLEKVYAPN